jgi:hypothetical protein
VAGFEHLYTSSRGVNHAMRDNGDGTFSISSSQDLESVLDYCKAAESHNDGYSPSRELKRAFFLPDVLVIKWMNEEGWNAYDPACSDRLVRKMNDPDYAYLKTAPGRIGQQKRMI